MTQASKVSIIMLTHNAPSYIRLAVNSLAAHTKDTDYELIVVDNGSRLATRLLLRQLRRQGKIHKLQLNRENLLFSRGNNQGSRLSAPEATHYLLLNSDVEIRGDRWLSALLALCPAGGISAYGVVRDEPVRADGYCILFDRALYDRYGLDERYEWFWSVTKIQAQTLCEGGGVVAVAEHESMLHHFGGKSGKAFRHAAGMSEDHAAIRGWFGQHHIQIQDRSGEEAN